MMSSVFFPFEGTEDGSLFFTLFGHIHVLSRDSL